MTTVLVEVLCNFAAEEEVWSSQMYCTVARAAVRGVGWTWTFFSYPRRTRVSFRALVQFIISQSCTVREKSKYFLWFFRPSQIRIHLL